MREVRGLGVNNHRPTIRACIAIAAIMAHRGVRVSAGNALLLQVCQDVLSVDSAKITRGGEPLIPQRIEQIVRKVCAQRDKAPGQKAEQIMIPSKTQRSLNVLRALSGLNTTAMAPHAAYMKITTLELEKLRLSKAREHALRRIGEIDGAAARTGGAKGRVAQLPGAGTQRAGARGVGAKGLRHNGGGRVRLTY